MNNRYDAIPLSVVDLLIAHDSPDNEKKSEDIGKSAKELDGRDILYLKKNQGDVHEKIPFLTMKEMEMRHILIALKEAGGSKIKAASLLDIGRSTLYEKLKYYGMDSYLIKKYKKAVT